MSNTFHSAEYLEYKTVLNSLPNIGIPTIRHSQQYNMSTMRSIICLLFSTNTSIPSRKNRAKKTYYFVSILQEMTLNIETTGFKC